MKEGLLTRCYNDIGVICAGGNVPFPIDCLCLSMHCALQMRDIHFLPSGSSLWNMVADDPGGHPSFLWVHSPIFFCYSHNRKNSTKKRDESLRIINNHVP